MRSAFYLKILVLLIVMVYFINSSVTYEKWHFLDDVNLLIHEAGHIIFMPFGKFVSITGGSILQILMPVVFLIYFIRKEMLYSGSLVMFGVGQSIINMSVYMKDAIEMKLPLLGGEIHDWNFIFSRLNLLSKTQFISSLFYFLGFLIIIIAGIFGLYSILKSKSNQDKILTI